MYEEDNTFNRTIDLSKPKISSLYEKNKFFEHIPHEICPGKPLTDQIFHLNPVNPLSNFKSYLSKSPPTQNKGKKILAKTFYSISPEKRLLNLSA